MTNQERGFIGTQAGGSPSTLTELADWFSNHATTGVGSVADELQTMLDDLLEMWDDDASKVVQGRLLQGRQGTDDLQDRLKKSGQLVAECADSLSRTQQNLPDVEQNAIGRRLEVTDHQVWHPEPQTPEGVPGTYSQAETTQHTNAVEQDYQRMAAEFDTTRAEAEAALSPLATALASVADNADLWKGLVFPASSFVAGEGQLLAKKYQAHAANKVRLSYGNFEHLNRVLHGASGIVARVLGGPANVVIPGLEAAKELHAGKRADRVLIKVGSGTLASAGVLLIGIWMGASPALIVVAMTLGGALGGSLGDSAYENFAPRTAWEILTVNDGYDYDRRGTVDTGGIYPE